MVDGYNSLISEVQNNQAIALFKLLERLPFTEFVSSLTILLIITFLWRHRILAHWWSIRWRLVVVVIRHGGSAALGSDWRLLPRCFWLQAVSQRYKRQQSLVHYHLRLSFWSPCSVCGAHCVSRDIVIKALIKITNYRRTYLNRPHGVSVLIIWPTSPHVTRC